MLADAVGLSSLGRVDLAAWRDDDGAAGVENERRSAFGPHAARPRHDKVVVDVSGPLFVNDRELVVAAALDGIGLSHIHEALVGHHLARRNGPRARGLVPPLRTFFLCYSGQSQLPPPLRVFVELARTWSRAVPVAP